MIVGIPFGVTLKIKLTRASQTYTFPIHLADEVGTTIGYIHGRGSVRGGDFFFSTRNPTIALIRIKILYFLYRF